MLSNDVIKEIRKYAIKNAIDYGKAQTANVLGKASKICSKGQINELKSEVERIVKEVNSLSKTQLEKEYKNYEKEFEVQYEKSEKLPQNQE